MATKNVLKLNDVRPSNPFADVQEDIPFALVDALVGKTIYIEAVKNFDNDEKGPGTHILFKDKETKEYGRTCTHSVGIVSLLSEPSVLEALDNGDVIECQFEVGVSKKTGRKVYRIKDAS